MYVGSCSCCCWVTSRYDTRKDLKLPADAPVVGLVLQRSHLVTGDEGHYSGVVGELEARGAKVVPVFAGEPTPCPLLLLLLLSFLSVSLLAEVLVGQSFSRTRPHACKSNVLDMEVK